MVGVMRAEGTGALHSRQTTIPCATSSGTTKSPCCTSSRSRGRRTVRPAGTPAIRRSPQQAERGPDRQRQQQDGRHVVGGVVRVADVDEGQRQKQRAEHAGPRPERPPADPADRQHGEPAHAARWSAARRTPPQRAAGTGRRRWRPARQPSEAGNRAAGTRPGARMRDCDGSLKYFGLKVSWLIRSIAFQA